MALLTPNAVYTMNGVTINEKIIPDGTRWKDSTKAARAGFNANELYKKNEKLSNNTGVVKKVTIHSTNDLDGVCDDAEQYTRATYNENMGSARVHFYTDENGAWQNLKAGTGLCEADPVGSAEVSWHAGDGSVPDGGNMTSISMEIIMSENATSDAKAKDNGARMAAWLLWKHKLTINDLVSHTYWVNKSAGKIFADVDKQCTNLISGQKWCPTYIFNSSNPTVAYNNWKAFKALVKTYLDKLNNVTTESATTSTSTIKYKKGDKVKCKATKHYASANADSGKECKPGVATITADPKPGTKHPYHCVATKEDGGTVYGWINEADIEAIATTTSTTTAKPTTSATGEKSYKVVSGDTLSEIAAKYNTTVAVLAAYNNISNPNIITVGQVIKIPAKTTASTATKPTTTTSKPATTTTTKPATTTTTKKDLSAVITKVIRGDYGNGTTRTQKLKAAGYTDAEIKEIQAGVDAYYNKKTTTTATTSKPATTAKPTTTATSKKSIDAVALEVIRGNWGNGTTRTQKLKAAGYTDAEIKQIQNKVNAYYSK